MLLTLLLGLLCTVALFAYLVVSRQVLPTREKERRRLRELREREAILARDREQEDRDCEKKATKQPENGTKKDSLDAFVVNFDQVGKDDADDVGGKGANLGELASGGLPVPGGFCITRKAFLERTDKKREVLDAVRAAYGALGSGNEIVAVRSSATCEDSQEASFAGQLESYLGLQGEDRVLEAVEKCWDSLNADRVIAYQKQQLVQASMKNIICCVVVQKMVDAKCAGVMFTANPLSRKRTETVVSASWGLGEAVVSDLITPDTWVVNSSTKEIVTETISTSKTRMYVMDKKTYAGSIVVDVEPPSQGASCLSREQISSLVDMGQRIEQLYGGSPRDIEWAIDNDTDALLILQARPITTNLESESGEEDKDEEAMVTMNEFDANYRETDWITKSNAAEMFPGAGTPLSISTFGRAANYGVQAMHCAFGVRDEVDEEEMVVGWFYGNQFLNMTNTLRVMCGGMIGATMGKENGEMSILGRINDECTVDDILAANKERYSIFRRLLNGARYVFTSVTAVLLRRPRLYERVSRIKDTLRRFHQDGDEKDNAEPLWECLDEFQSDYLDQWTDGIVISSISAAFMLGVMKLLCLNGKYKAWSTEAVADVTALISSNELEEVAESCDAVKSLDVVAEELIKSNNDKFVDNFLKMSPKEAFEQVLTGNKLFAKFLDRHGHRCIKEAEMRTLEWGEDPVAVVKLLQNSVKARRVKTSGSADKQKSGGSGKLTTEMVLRKQNSSILRSLISGMAYLARIGVRNRELGKSLCIAHHTELKRGYRLLGRILAKHGRIHDPDLVFFLTHAELGTISSSNAPERTISRLKNRALKRRRLLPLQDRLHFKELYHGKPLPEEVRAVSDAERGSAKGTPVCTGIAIGKARVVRTLDEANEMEPGEILICPQTDVGWCPYFSLASGLVTEIGGLLSHGAVVAREYGLPCVVNVDNACNRFINGQLVKLDGSSGVIAVIEEEG